MAFERHCPTLLGIVAHLVLLGCSGTNSEAGSEDPTLVLARVEEDLLELAELPIGGELHLLPPVMLSVDRSNYTFYVNDAGTHALFVTSKLADDPAPERLQYHTLVELQTGRAIHLEELLDDNVCQRSSSRHASWRSDGEGVYISCAIDRVYQGEVVRTESVLYLLYAEGAVEEFSGGCPWLHLSTDDGRAVVSTRENCSQEAEYVIWGSATTPIPLRVDERILYWWEGGVFVASIRVEAELFRYFYENLYWLSPSGERRLLAENLSPQTVFGALSPGGAIPIMSAEEEGFIESVDFRSLNNEPTVLDVPRCAGGVGRWARDGHAFLLSCNDASWIVNLDGRATRINPPESPSPRQPDFWWSGNDEFLLGPLYSEGDEAHRFQLVDVSTGVGRTLPAVSQFRPSGIAWRSGESSY